MNTPYSDGFLKHILVQTKTIALVGASANEMRPSHGVMKFLLARGYDVIPVNPGLAGQDLLGQKVYAYLSEIPRQIDMIDVFRASDAVPQLVAEALQLEIKPHFLWTQLGVVDEAAATTAEAHGIKVVMNRCPAIEIPRLGL